MKIFLLVVLISYILCVLGAIVNMVYAYIPELKDWKKENTDLKWGDLFSVIVIVPVISVLCPVLNFALTVILVTKSVENLRNDYNKIFTRARLSYLEKKR